MRYLIKEGKTKELKYLSLIYLLSQGFLLIATGRWWDDWCNYGQSQEVMKEIAMRLGRPIGYVIGAFAQAMPEPGYRIVTFIMFYFCMLFTYKIMKKWLNASDSACFWICALYAVIPANDLRITLSVFPYTVGLFWFMAGLSLFSGALFDNKLNWWRRILCLLIFFISFDFNSILCLYAIIFVMILMHEKSLVKLFKYIDFIILPFAYFIGKNILFPVYGEYTDYNTLSITSLLKAIAYVIPADALMIHKLVSNWVFAFDYLGFFIVFVAVIVVFCLQNKERVKNTFKDVFSIFRKSDSKKKAKKEKAVSKKHRGLELSKGDTRENVLILLCGIVVLTLGLFAYVTIRQTAQIGTSGIDGRDATLVALGAAMIIYSFVRMLFKESVSKYIFISLICLGIMSFNVLYVAYQQDYYRQLGFQYQLTQNEKVKDSSLVAYINDDVARIKFDQFYVLNGSAELAYGDQTRLISGGLGSIVDLYDEENSIPMEYLVESTKYHMKDYDSSNKKVDTIILYSFDSRLYETVILKLYEMFDKDKFNRFIEENSYMTVLYEGTKEFDSRILASGYINDEKGLRLIRPIEKED